MAEQNTQQDLREILQIRRDKLKALQDAGMNPFEITRYDVTHHAQEVKDNFDALEGQTVSLGGRLMSKRGMGKVSFCDLQDKSGRIQIYARRDEMDEEAYSRFKKYDIGDIVGVKGQVFRTQKGEMSIRAHEITLLSKSLQPLPEKFHGLTDREVRYRQRYVDLIMNPEVRDTFRKRSQIISLIRRYMEADGYMEVETPMMHAILGGANAKPFVTHFNALDRDFYLRIATELPLKRCIVGGLERVFEIGRQFRNEGMDLTHNPEFTSMEAYCAYSDLDGMKELTQGLFKTIAREVCGCEEGHEVITYQGQTVDMSGTWESLPLSEVASRACGEHVDMDTPIERLRQICEKHGIEWQENWGAGKLVFELYDELGEATLVNPTFVCDYPEEVSPLSKRKDDDPRLTDRFELVICGHEYANAFSELNDPVDQAGRFAEQVAAKGFGDDEAMGYDYDYVRALEYGMPPAGGIGYGIDRMIMLFCDAPAIRDVLLFPQMKPEVITRADIASQLPETTDNAAASVDALADDAEHGASNEAAAAHADAPALETGLTRDQAFDLLKKYNEDPFHIAHGQTLEGLMRYYAQKYDPANVEFWGQVGLLHDLDWEKFQDEVQHTVKAAELIEEAGGTRELARAIQTHNSDNNPDLPAPSCKMECVLFACDELSGLIQAAVLMRPSKSVMDFELKSLKKKFKDKRFAAGCDRDVIRKGAELNGMELDDLFASVIEAMKAIQPTCEGVE